jgi:hypothetical protein
MRKGMFVRILALIFGISFFFICSALSQSHFYHFVGILNYGPTEVNRVFDVTSDGKIGVALSYGSTNGLVTFNPLTGTQLDNYSAINNHTKIAIAETPEGTRAVVLAYDIFDNIANRTAFTFDISPTGIITKRARTRLTHSEVDFLSNPVLSPQGKVGFVVYHPDILPSQDELVAFSLDDGGVFSRLPVGFPFENIAIKEVNGHRYITLFRLSSPPVLTVIDATNPSAMMEIGSVVLPRNVEFSGFPDTAMLFTADGRYVFVANMFINLAAVDLQTMQVVGSFGSEFRFNRMRLFETPLKKLIAIESSDSGTVSNINSLLLIDATDPSNLTMIKRLDFSQYLGPTRTDLTFTRSGNYIFLALEDKLKVLLVPSLSTFAEEPIVGNLLMRAHQIQSFGQPEKIMGAWGVNIIGIFDAPTSPPFDLCVQDEASEDILSLNTVTGDYQLTQCHTGLVVEGKGLLAKKGCSLTLQHNSIDRRIVARIDTCQNKGTATVQLMRQGIFLNIIDRNTTNNTCSCPNSN